jgi:hypothetical protein
VPSTLQSAHAKPVAKTPPNKFAAFVLVVFPHSCNETTVQTAPIPAACSMSYPCFSTSSFTASSQSVEEDENEAGRLLFGSYGRGEEQIS